MSKFRPKLGPVGSYDDLYANVDLKVQDDKALYHMCV